jgi:hypothetical protein
MKIDKVVRPETKLLVFFRGGPEISGQHTLLRILIACVSLFLLTMSNV